MNFVTSFIKGLFIGIGSIIPGVSGGTLTVIFGIYEKITDLIANIYINFRKTIKTNFIFFLPIFLGVLVGILGFSRIMEFLFANYNEEVKYLFIGLIIGTLPLLFKQANSNGFRIIYLIPFVIAIVTTIAVTVIDNNNTNINIQHQNILLLLFYGVILGFGTIIPGISASVILMHLGAYDYLLSNLADLNILILAPIGAGFIFSILIFAKIINYLFKKAYSFTYYTILGFVVGSIVPIFPGFTLNMKYIICIFLLILGFLISFKLSITKK